MARITVEDCLQTENNRFALVQLASKRTRQLLAGALSLVQSKNKMVVTSLREIADGGVRFKTEADLALERQEEEKRLQAAAEAEVAKVESANGIGESEPAVESGDDSSDDSTSEEGSESESSDESDSASEDSESSEAPSDDETTPSE